MKWHNLIALNARLSSLLIANNAIFWVFLSHLAWSISSPLWWQLLLVSGLTLAAAAFLFLWQRKISLGKKQ